MKKNYINENLNKLSSRLIFMENKFKKYYKILEMIPHDKISPIFTRNLFYLNLILEKIKLNLSEINSIKKQIKAKKGVDKTTLKKKGKELATISLVLLNYLFDLLKNYGLEYYDFEIQSKINLDEQESIRLAPKGYNDVIKDEFETIDYLYIHYKDSNENLNKDGKIIEPLKGLVRRMKRGLNRVKGALNKAVNFAKRIISSITNGLKAMFNAIKKIIQGIKKIGQFLTKFLVQFIMILWKIFKALWRFITVTIPKLVRSIVPFFKLLFYKLKETGAITFMLYFVLSIIVSKYWDLLLADMEVQGFSPADTVPEF